MYPTGDLKQLALRKELIEARIRLRRLQSMVHGAELAKPINWVDRAWTRWRQISPVVKLVGIPVALGLGRKFMKRHGTLSGVLRFAPMVLQGVRMATQMRGSHASQSSRNGSAASV